MYFGIPEGDNPNLYILGVKWDASSSYRKGASRAPQVIREATSSKLYNSFTEDLVDLASTYTYRDLGDIEARDYREIMIRVVESIKKGGRDALYLFLGGDHSITYSTIKALRMHHYPDGFHLLYFDAHPDLYDIYGGDIYSHACVLRRIIEDELVDPGNVTIIGVRAATPEQVEYAIDRGINIVTMKQLEKHFKKLLSSKEQVYISIDLDVLDPAYAPGVGNPEPGGLSTRQLLDFIWNIKGEIVGFDIVEYNPLYDSSNVTAYTAAKLIREVLGLAARRFK
ncbi:MAG: agmatinase [Desulfurococcales archaeon]|nr:agmatinase [Desulfurococcales archaeon]